MEAPVGSVPLLGYRRTVNPAPEEAAQGGCQWNGRMCWDDQQAYKMRGCGKQTTRSACVWQAADLVLLAQHLESYGEQWTRALEKYSQNEPST